MGVFGELAVKLDPWQVEYRGEVPALAAPAMEECRVPQRQLPTKWAELSAQRSWEQRIPFRQSFSPNELPCYKGEGDEFLCTRVLCAGEIGMVLFLVSDYETLPSPMTTKTWAMVTL